MQQPLASIFPGSPTPLGATLGADGVNFAIYTRHAERVDLCLFDDSGTREVMRAELPGRMGHVWHGYVDGLTAGRLYGYRVHGPFQPEHGHRFNPSKLLIDPYARAVSGGIDWEAGRAILFDDEAPVPADTAAAMPKCVVISDAFDWAGDSPPMTPLGDSVIYETHVKGFSIRHPGVAAAERGTFRGLASPAAIDHFKRLGVTAIELLPVAEHADSLRLHDLGLTDYWGYSPLAWFAPDGRFSASGDRGGQVSDFKYMVRELHRHGLEVILDVVYNHTCEGDRAGPTLSLRGIDNVAYYHLDPQDCRHYLNFTGTGNTVKLEERYVLKLVLDSLRYWVQEMHVDGFRFDLAPALARVDIDFSQRSPFLGTVFQDPVLSRVKLIAEPWDLGPNGYQAGHFPSPWSEWNDGFRDTVRRYWCGDDGGLSDLARRLTGSPDRFDDGERGPTASVNYLTSHDGFTLHDLVSYAQKHNQQNGENNHDGSSESYSDNLGAEGPTLDASINASREQRKRNLLATLLLSRGVPMLLGGDEIGRTQVGNNNPYNQDNTIGWYNWHVSEMQDQFLRFTQRLIEIRHRYPALRREHYVAEGDQWMRETGEPIDPDDWNAPWLKCLGLLMPGSTGRSQGETPRTTDDPDLLLILNSSATTISFRLPEGTWSLVIDTTRPTATATNPPEASAYLAAAQSLVLLRGEP